MARPRFHALRLAYDQRRDNRHRSMERVRIPCRVLDNRRAWPQNNELAFSFVLGGDGVRRG